jgi:hypothetical protein
VYCILYRRDPRGSPTKRFWTHRHSSATSFLLDSLTNIIWNFGKRYYDERIRLLLTHSGNSPTELIMVNFQCPEQFSPAETAPSSSKHFAASQLKTLALELELSSDQIFKTNNLWPSTATSSRCAPSSIFLTKCVPPSKEKSQK